MLKNGDKLGFFESVFEMGERSKNADLSGDMVVLCDVVMFGKI